MTAALAASLDAKEAIIEKGMHTFVEVGNALLAIRDGKLYRAEYPTFERYCEGRWGMSRPRAYALMGAAETVAALSPIGDTPLPATESQARELRGLPVETAAEVMREAASSGTPTARSIGDARARLTGPTPPVIPSAIPATPARVEPIVDRQTGEIADDPGLARLELRNNFLRAEGRAHDLVTFPVEALSAALNPDDYARLIHVRRGINDFFDRLDAARPSGLRVVSGG